VKAFLKSGVLTELGDREDTPTPRTLGVSGLLVSCGTCVLCVF